MIYEEENDYIMRMIKEAARVLFSLIFGKKYTQVELPKENKFSVSGSNLDDLTGLVDQGKINEADRRVCRIWGSAEYRCLVRLHDRGLRTAYRCHGQFQSRLLPVICLVICSGKIFECPKKNSYLYTDVLKV